MEVEIKYNFELIAERVPTGDNWRLLNWKTGVIFTSLTLCLEAYFQQSGFKGAYKLDPLDSKLFIITEQEVEIEEVIEPVVEEVHYGLYGEFKQGA